MRAVIFKDGRVSTPVKSTELDPIWKDAQNEGVHRNELVSRLIETVVSIDGGTELEAALEENRVGLLALDAFVRGTQAFYGRYAPTDPPSYDAFIDWAYGKGYYTAGFFFQLDNNRDDAEYRVGPPDMDKWDFMDEIAATYDNYHWWQVVLGLYHAGFSPS